MYAQLSGHNKQTEQRNTKGVVNATQGYIRHDFWQYIPNRVHRYDLFMFRGDECDIEHKRESAFPFIVFRV